MPLLPLGLFTSFMFSTVKPCYCNDVPLQWNHGIITFNGLLRLPPYLTNQSLYLTVNCLLCHFWSALLVCTLHLSPLSFYPCSMHLSNQRHHPSVILEPFAKLLSMSSFNVTFYSCMSLVGRAWVFVTFTSTHHNCCLLLCMWYVIGCDLLPVRWPSVWPSQYMWQVFVVVCMPFDVTRQGLEENSLKFLASSCSKQNSLCFIIFV